MFGVFRRRDFTLLWFSGLVSVAGDRVLSVALPFYVYVQTGSTVATAGLVAAKLAPGILLGSVGGVLADRWDRRRILVVTNVLQAVVVAALLLVTGADLMWVVYAVAGTQSALSAFAGPAEAALLPTLVANDQLVAANAMNALNDRLGRLSGVPAGAALLGWLGLEAVVLVDCLSFAVAAVLVASMSPQGQVDDSQPHDGGPAEQVRGAATGFWAQWLDGLRVVRRDRTIAVLFLTFGVMTFAGTMQDPLVVAWVRDVLASGVDVYAGLLTVHAVAGIAASLGVGWLGSRVAPRTLIGWSCVLAGLALLVRYNLPVVAVAVGLTALGGVLSVASSVGAETLAQERVPPHLRGRVFGSLQATIGLLSLLGATAGGVLGEAAGLLPALDVATALISLSGVLVLVAVPTRPRGVGSPRAAERKG